MNMEQARFNMIEQQIRPWDVLDQRVLDLLFTVKREDFVPDAYKALAFSDVELPLGHGQAMLAPKLEARLLQELAVKSTDRVLEIGTGSGYMAALLASRAEHVITVEINAGLAQQAVKNLERARVANVTVEVGDASKGVSALGRFDVILFSGAVAAIPQEVLAVLREGGRLAAVVGSEPAMQAQLVVGAGEGIFATQNLFETVVPYLRGFEAAQTFQF